jgi:acetolactate synthase-1/2/3 large subunit
VGGPHSLAAGFVKWANQVSSVEILYEMFRRAGEIAAAKPRGPVYLNVSLETLLDEWTPPRERRPVPAAGKQCSAPEEVARVAKSLAAAAHPVIVTESAGRDQATFDALDALCEGLAIGVVEPDSALCTSFDQTSDMYMGSRHPEASNVDFVMLVGACAPWYPPSANPYPNARVVVIDDVPQRPHRVYQVLEAHDRLAGDMAATLRALLEAAASEVDPDAVSARRAELAALHITQRDALAAAERAAAGHHDRISPVRLVAELRRALPPDAMIFDETITHGPTIQRHLLASEPGRWRYVQGGLGQGSGVALGAKLAVGDRMVVLACGDGGFLYNPMVQALMASRTHKLPFLIVIFNNRQYRAMKVNYERFYPDGVAATHNDQDGLDLSDQPPLSEFAGPFGFLGREVHEPSQLADALYAGVAEVAAGRTAIIDVILDDYL